MPYLLIALQIFASLLLVHGATAFAANNKAPLPNEMARHVREAKSLGGSYGLDIIDLQSGLPLFSRNENAALNPASGMKLLTSAAALSLRGPDYRFETWVRKVDNDLCLIGRGDPSLVSETLWMLAQEVFRKIGKHPVQSITFDDSYFESTRVNPGQFGDSASRAFTAPIGSLSVNYNAIAIYVRPGKSQSAEVRVEPDLKLFSLRNEVRMSNQKEKPWAVVKERGDKIEVTVTGKVTSGDGESVLYRSVPTPARYTALLFRELLEGFGMKVAGEVVRKKCSEDLIGLASNDLESRLLARFESKPMSEIVRLMGKFSNNFMADMLLRGIGPLPTDDSGVQAIDQWLNAVGVAHGSLRLENGSGLSRNTRVTPRTMTSLIRVAANDLRFGPEFLSALPIAGVDGTLKNRLKDARALGVARGKTGWLSGVVSLSGVAQTLGGRKLVYSFVFNVPERRQYEALKLADRMLETIVTAPIDS